MRRSLLLLGALAALAIARPAAAAWPISPYVAAPVCTATNDQSSPAIVSDGTGGAYIAWADDRSGSNYDLYVSHIIDGAPAPGWPANGLAVCTAAAMYRYNIALVMGAAGDVYVAWTDQRTTNTDSYVQRVLPNATIAPGWPAGGLGIAIDLRNQDGLRACTDGAGGIYVAWTLEFTPGTDYDVYATRVLPNATFPVAFGAGGVVINGAALVQDAPDITADGAGNAIIAFENIDGSNVGQIYAQLLGPAAQRTWGATNTGVQINYIGNDQRNPHIVSDGASGAVVVADLGLGAETDQLIYFLNPNGTRRGYPGRFAAKTGALASTQAVAPDGRGGVWALIFSRDPTNNGVVLIRGDASSAVVPSPTSGVLLGTVTGVATLGALAPRTDGGVLATYLDPKGDHFILDLHAQAFDANATPLWPGGRIIARSNGSRSAPVAVTDGNNGAIVTWYDDRNGPIATNDIFAARVDRFGALGDAAPHIAKIADVPNDQGGHVSLQWTSSYLDASPSFPVARYSVWRRVPGGVQAFTPAHAASVLAPDAPRAPGTARTLRAQPTAAGVIYWEFLFDTPARGYAGYSAVVATSQDSMAASNARISLRVEAESAAGIPFWDSAPDSGYSVDNIPPVVPAPFTGQFGAGLARLHWNPNADADLAGYRVYRGVTAGFVPSPATLVATPSDTGLVLAASAPYVYKLTAIDVHGNESPAATWIASGTLAVGDAAAPALALAPPAPNPASRAATLRFTLPRPGRARVVIMDTAGRIVREWADTDLAAGEHVLAWDLADASGRPAPAGLYFARLEAAGRTLQQRIVVMR